MVTKKEIIDALDSNLILIIIEPGIYQKTIGALTKILIEDRGMSGIYFTSNQPCNAILRRIENILDIHKIKFVDAISKLVQSNVQNNDSCTYLKSPRDLTNISVAIMEEIEKIHATEGRHKFVIFDSLSTMAIYNEEEVIKKFAHYLANKSRSLANTITILITTNEKEATVNELVQFCDKVLKIKEIIE